MKKKTRAMIGTIFILIALSSLTVTGMDIPFACFADGEVFHMDGTPVDPGINVTITNLETKETINTNTGYPNYPPVKQYDNDFKSVFVCKSGYDKIGIKAWNKTHYGYEEVLVPKGSQALINITLDKEIGRERPLLGLINKIIKYFLGKEKQR